jgi:hypothetical protein
MSDVGLKKLCRRNGIPTPPQGYHLISDPKKKKRLVQPLPPVQKYWQEIFRFKKPILKQDNEGKSEQDRWDQFRAANQREVSRRDIREIDGVLKLVRKPMHLRSTDERGILKVPAIEHPIRVAPTNFARAYAILKELLVRLAGLGAAGLQYDEDSTYEKLSIEWNGYRFSLRIEEHSIRVEKKHKRKTTDELLWLSRYDKWDFIPTGKLVLDIFSRGIGHVTTRDGKVNIEDRMDQLLIRLFLASEEQAERDRLEEIRRQEAIAQQKKLDEERLAKEYLQLKQDALMEESRRWMEVENLRCYLAEVERKGPRSGRESFESESEWQEWLNWAKDY